MSIPLQFRADQGNTSKVREHKDLEVAIESKGDGSGGSVSQDETVL